MSMNFARNAEVFFGGREMNEHNEHTVTMLQLNDGRTIPQVGLGTWKLNDDEAERVVGEALELGYRHFDTATVYENERGVGRAIAASGLPRDEIFVTTKLANPDQQDPHGAFEASLERLGLDYVDLYLIHWPVPSRGHAVSAWRGLVEIVGSHQCNSVGVSNFEIAHLDELRRETGVVPVANQIELHPANQRRELREYCAEHSIMVESWGPLSQGKTDLLERAEILEAARLHGKTPAQIVLRWHVQHGLVVIPKSSRRERLKENLELFDFELTEQQMQAIDDMEEGLRLGADPFTHE